jgi:hypothetical protein
MRWCVAHSYFVDLITVLNNIQLSILVRNRRCGAILKKIGKTGGRIASTSKQFAENAERVVLNLREG